MNDAYQAKLRKEAQGKAALAEELERRRRAETREAEAAARRNIEREQRLDDAAEAWTKHIVPSWPAPGMPHSRRARELLRTVGIPPRVRGVVWALALGNALMITRELYDIFGAQATRARKQRVAELAALNNAQNGQPAAEDTVSAPHVSSSLPPSPSFAQSLGKSSSFAYIDVDLTRTFPSLAFFQEECPMHDQLRHLLYTFAFYRPDIGYVQGMSYLAGNLLCTWLHSMHLLPSRIFSTLRSFTPSCAWTMWP